MEEEPATPPSEHVLDALHYMMRSLRKPAPERPLPFILTADVAKEAFDKGVDLGTGFAMVSSTPDGILYQPITAEEFYATGEDIFAESYVQSVVRKQRELIDHWLAEIEGIDGFRPRGGNIGGNASEDT